MRAATDPGGPRGARERILAAATDIAGREGLEALTTRGVAQVAGVNVGLLHYYFESKEALVEETLSGFLAELLSLAGGPPPSRGIADEGRLGSRLDGPALMEEDLAILLERALDLAARRPGLLFGLISKLVETVQRTAGRTTDQAMALALLNDSPVGALARVETSLFHRIRPLLCERLGDDPELVGRRAIQLFTSIFHPMLFTPFPAIIFGVELKDEKQKKAYVRAVIRDALSPPSQP